MKQESLDILNGVRTTAPEENSLPDNFPPENFPVDDCRRIIAPRTIAHEDNCLRVKFPQDNCPLTRSP